MIKKQINQEILNDLKNGMSKKEILNKFLSKVSKATIYRLFSYYENKNEIEIKNDNDIYINEPNNNMDDKENDNETYKDSDKDSDNENDKSESTKEPTWDQKQNDNDDGSDNSINTMQDGLLKFIEGNQTIEDHENKPIENEPQQETDTCSVMNDKINLQPIQEDTIRNMVHNFVSENAKETNNNIELNNFDDNMRYEVPPVSSQLTHDDYKERRKIIIYIRNYIENFKDRLRPIIGYRHLDQENFKMNLIKYDLPNLTLILENIRFELCIKNNSKKVLNTLETLLRSLETIAMMAKIDITGSADELLKNPQFVDDVMIMSCEIDISSIINPKTSVFMATLTQFYKNYYTNKLKNKLNTIKPDIEIQKKFDTLINNSGAHPSIPVGGVPLSVNTSNKWLSGK